MEQNLDEDICMRRDVEGSAGKFFTCIISLLRHNHTGRTCHDTCSIFLHNFQFFGWGSQHGQEGERSIAICRQDYMAGDVL